MCVSKRRRPITSPPGGGMCSLPARAVTGPASRMEARMRRQRSRSRPPGRKVGEVSRQVFASKSSTRVPRLSIKRRMSSTSRICGTFRKTTGSSVNKQAARSGKAAFLFPAGVISPRKGTPPSIINSSISSSSPGKSERIVRQFEQFAKRLTVDLHEQKQRPFGI